MIAVYAHEKRSGEDRPSIFLAGPSPRADNACIWRPDALAQLDRIFDGEVYVPLPREGGWLEDYTGQIDWELEYLERASAIAFWIPRCLEKLPAFTTNIEFGMYLGTRKIVLGYPPGAPNMKYMDYVARKKRVEVCHTLGETLLAARLLALNNFHGSTVD